MRGTLRHTQADHDRGSATVWVLAAGLLTVLVALASSAAAAAVVARHRAEGAADLGALAGSARVFEGEGVACRVAAEIVAANGGSLVACRLDGLDLIVTAEVDTVGAAELGGTARAAARAGPTADEFIIHIGAGLGS